MPQPTRPSEPPDITREATRRPRWVPALALALLVALTVGIGWSAWRRAQAPAPSERPGAQEPESPEDPADADSIPAEEILPG